MTRSSDESNFNVIFSFFRFICHSEQRQFDYDHSSCYSGAGLYVPGIGEKTFMPIVLQTNSTKYFLLFFSPKTMLNSRWALLVAGTSKLPWVGWWKPIIEGISKYPWCFSSNAWTFVPNAFKRNFHSMWKHQEITDAREGQKFQRNGEGDLSRPYRQNLASRVLIDLPLSNHVRTQTCWKFGKQSLHNATIWNVCSHLNSRRNENKRKINEMKSTLHFKSNCTSAYINKSNIHCCDRECFRFSNKNTKKCWSNLSLQIINLAAAKEIVNIWP